MAFNGVSVDWKRNVLIEDLFVDTMRYPIMFASASHVSNIV